MNPHDDIIEYLDKRPCGCVMTEYAGGRKTFAPCVACGLMRAGFQLSKAAVALLPWRRRRHLLDAGNALAAVATTIMNTANKKAEVVNVINNTLAQASADDEIKQDQPEGNHPGQTGD